MKAKKVGAVGAVVLVCAVFFLAIIFWPSEGRRVSNTEEQTLVADAEPVQKKEPVKKVTNEADEEELFNAYQEEELKAQLQQAADIYEENIKYPNNSQPVYNSQDVREYEPFEQAEVDLPFFEDDEPKEGEEPIRLAASTEQFQYFRGDTINARLKISGAPQDTFIDVNGILSSANGDIPIEINFQSTDRSMTEFRAAIDSNLAPVNLFSSEMLLKLNVKVGSRDLNTTVVFRFNNASAQLVGIQQVRPEGAELIIPLQYNVFQSGYYFVQAVLEDASSNQPLIQLQGEGRVSQGNAVITLKAHIAALKRQGSEGPYRLRSIRAYRGAGVGEQIDVPASTSQPSFDIPGYPFSAYEDVEYVDPIAQERLDFLRNLGAVDEAATLENEPQREPEALQIQE